VSQLERFDIAPAALWTSLLPIMETSCMAQHCGPTAAVAVISRDPTFAPRTPATSPNNNRRIHLSLVCPRRGLVTGVCVQEGGKCPVLAPTVQSLCHALCVNRHTRPTALVDQAGLPCRGIQRL